jgi:hypothetical protein
VTGFKENEFIPTILWLGIYLLSFSTHLVYFLFLGDQQFELGGQNGDGVNY